MKREALIKLLRASVPKGGEVVVENIHIHDDTMEVIQVGSKNTIAGIRYLLCGKVGP